MGILNIPFLMSKIQKLNQIKYIDHYSIFDKNGIKILDCGSVEDAIMMCTLDKTRTYKQVKILLDQIVNVHSTRMDDDKQLKEQNILPERQQEPFVVND